MANFGSCLYTIGSLKYIMTVKNNLYSNVNLFSNSHSQNLFLYLLIKIPRKSVVTLRLDNDFSV